MNIYFLYIELSIFIVVGISSLMMAINGFDKGNVFHTSGCPPIIFKEKTIKFILWSICLLAISTGYLIGVIYTILNIMV